MSIIRWKRIANNQSILLRLSWYHSNCQTRWGARGGARPPNWEPKPKYRMWLRCQIYISSFKPPINYHHQSHFWYFFYSPSSRRQTSQNFWLWQDLHMKKSWRSAWIIGLSHDSLLDTFKVRCRSKYIIITDGYNAKQARISRNNDIASLSLIHHPFRSH